MPDDIVAMISQHRRERDSALTAGEQTGWWTWPLEMWVASKFALRWVVTLALHPAEALDVLELWNRAPAPPVGKQASPNICRDCHAANDPGTSECWRCGRRDWRADPASPATKLSDEPSDRAILMSPRSTFLFVLALAVVGTAVARLAPTLGILLLVCALSTWALTILVAEWKKGEQSPFFVIVLPWILLPILVFVLPVVLVIALVVYSLWLFLR